MNVNENRLKPWHVIAGTALSAIPYISISGDYIKDIAKTKKLEKSPIKDCFKVVAEKRGGKYSEWLSKIKINAGKLSNAKLGAIGMGVFALGDLILTTWCVKSIANAIGRKHSK